MRLELLAASALMVAVLIYGYRRETARRVRWQRALLNGVNAPLDACEQRLEADGYPALYGEFGGYPAQIQLLRDDVTVRKVPCLWLSVSLRAKLPGSVALSVLARMRGTEFYSPMMTLTHRLEPLPAWPGELTVKCDAASAPLAALSDWVQAYFSDPRAKELQVSPSGVRVIYQFAQARRPEYLVLRAGHFDTEPVPAELMRDLLARTLAVIRTMKTHDNRTESTEATA